MGIYNTYMLYRMNYLTDFGGIYRRYKREKGRWDSHLNNTKQFIIDSVENKSGTIVVLGSGWLLDFPIDQIIKQFSKVILYDIKHPGHVKKLAAKHSNLELVCADITGGMLERCFKLKQSQLKSDLFNVVSYLSSSKFTIDFDADYIVSLNIMNQLDILLIDYLKQKGVKSDGQLLKLRKMIQEKHLEFLSEYNHAVITDIEEEWRSEDDEFLGVKPTLYADISKYKEQKKWPWNFDSSMTYYDDKKVILNVIAFNGFATP
jgi:hypothetical protein